MKRTNNKSLGSELPSLNSKSGSLKQSTADGKQQTSYTFFPITPTVTLAFLLLLFQFSVEALGADQPVVRLLVAENEQRAVVKAGSFSVERRDGRHWKREMDGAGTLVFNRNGTGVLLEGTGATGDCIRIRAKNGVFSFEGKNYRGNLVVTVQDGGLILVASMPLETYLPGVVNGEVDSQWPLDALMAQVVAARTYALYRIGLEAPLFDLRTDVSDQVYAGADSEDKRSAEAVRRTRGEALYHEGRIIPAFFHSSCGGETASSSEVWGIEYPSMKGIRCGECAGAPYSRWHLSLSPSQVRAAAGKLFPEAGKAHSLGIHSRTDDGRVLTLFFETDATRVLIDAADFRKILGYERLPSTRFALSSRDGMVIFKGSGYGHGVGLCQWGARGSALRGMNYRQILRKYYVGADVRRAY